MMLFRLVLAVTTVGIACRASFAASDSEGVRPNAAEETGSSFAFRAQTVLQRETVVATNPDVQATVVFFFGTECPLAHLYASRMRDLAHQFSARGVAFIAVNSNSQDSTPDIQRFVQEHAWLFPVVQDVGNVIADRYGATRTPEVFLLDRQLNLQYQGRIDDQFQPGIKRSTATRDDLRIAIDELLAGTSIEVSRTDAVGCKIGKVKSQSVPDADQAINYSQHVSPILKNYCVDCHRCGEIGPFAMERYEDVIGWGDTIVEVIDTGRMPPWHADPTFGKFANARIMTEQEKALVRSWVAAGMPQGDSSALTPARSDLHEWQLAKNPDHVFGMRQQPYDVAAKGAIEYQYFVVDPKFTEDRWVAAAQIIPGNRNVVHHAIVFIRPPDGTEVRGVGWLTAYVPGQRLPNIPPGYARKIPAGSKLVFQMHYTTKGSPQQDLTRVGLTLIDRSHVTHEIMTLIALDQEFEIPPHASSHVVSAEVRWKPNDGHLLAIAPHMHVRGKSFTLLSDHDGTTETLLHVPKYDFNWQHSYELSTPRPLNELGRIRFSASFDNSVDNPVNPDPTQWVHWGDQTWEEMAVAFLEVAVPVKPETDVSLSGPKKALLKEDDNLGLDRSSNVQNFVEEFFTRLDVNGDGVVHRAEAPLVVRINFWRFDTNNDLKIERAEVQAIAERRIQE